MKTSNKQKGKIKMKKIALFLIIALLGFSNSLFSQNKVENTIKAIINALTDANYKIINVATQTVTVNSTSNATFSSGKSRGAFKFSLPEGTKKIAVRVTVIPVKSDFQYEDEESFYSLLQKSSAKEVAAPQNNGINFYLFNRSYDADAFVGKNNFNALWIINNTNSFIQSRFANPGNYWIGIQNPNSMSGLKAIVEIVALGNF